MSGAIMAAIEKQRACDIRRLSDNEVDAVVEVLGLARLHQGNGCYLVAWAASAPLGHVHLALTEPPELQDLEVLPSHRRQGVATALVAAAEREAHVRGFSELRLEVSMGDVAAQALYRKCGYRDAGLGVRRVKGRIVLRTGAIDVDDSLLSLTKRWPG
jgi:[ribosomal protein S18]-alanine N-acetyltransferase